MKKLMTSLALTLLIAGAAAAQVPQKERKTPEERAKHQTEMMTKNLALTAEQVPQVQTINLKYADQLGDLKEQPKGEKGAKRDAAKELRDKRNAELKGVLTAEQYDKMIKGQEAMQARRQDKMHEHHDQKENK